MNLKGRFMRLTGVLCSIALIAVTACASGVPNPEVAVQRFWAAMEAGDHDAAAQYVSERAEGWDFESFDLEDEEFFDESMTEAFLDRVDVRTVGHAIDGEEATVDVSVTWPDLGRLMGRFVGRAMQELFGAALAGASEDEIDAMAQPIFFEVLEETPDVETEHSVRLALEDGEWRLLEHPVPDPEDVFDIPDEWTEDAPDGREKTASLGEPISLRGGDAGVEVQVTVVRMVDPANPAEFQRPSEGHRYTAIEIELENVGENTYDGWPANGAALIDDRRQQYDDTFADVTDCVGLQSVTIRPGDGRLGCVVFEIPDDATPERFQFRLDAGFGPDTGIWELR